jgi:hypothetical protein
MDFYQHGIKGFVPRYEKCLAFSDDYVEMYGKHCTIQFELFLFSSMAQQPLFGQDLLITEVSWSTHLDTPHSAGLLWTSN